MKTNCDVFLAVHHSIEFFSNYQLNAHFLSVAYTGIFFSWGGGIQQIQLRTERMGIWGR